MKNIIKSKMKKAKKKIRRKKKINIKNKKIVKL